jgi:hypothetical protein
MNQNSIVRRSTTPHGAHVQPGPHSKRTLAQLISAGFHWMKSDMVNKAQSDPKKTGQLKRELAAMPDMKLRQQAESFKLSNYIFDTNYAEFKKLLDFFINDPKSETLALSVNQDRLNEIQMDILRHLHNFVAASLALIDHTRNLYQELYRDSGNFIDYPKRIRAEFETDPLSQFVKGLGKYLQNNSSPEIFVEESFSQNAYEKPTPKKRVLIYTSDLVAFDGWNRMANKYMNKPAIDLLEMADFYRIKVLDFQRWFMDRQDEIQGEQLER